MSIKNHIILNEKNFKRLKKNIFNHISKEHKEIKQFQIAEIMAKSMGFSSYDHAVHESFKTDKYSGKENKQLNYSGVKNVYSWLFLQKEKYSELLFYRGQTEKNSNIESQIFEKTLNPYKHIFNDLLNYLNIEVNYGFRFCFHDWLEEIISVGFLREIFIGIDLKDLLNKVFSQFSETELNLKDIFLESVADFATCHKNIEITSLLFYNISDIPNDLICKAFYKSDDEMKVKLIKIAIRRLLNTDKFINDWKLTESEISSMFEFIEKIKDINLNNFNDDSILLNTKIIKENLFLPLSSLKEFFNILLAIKKISNDTIFEKILLTELMDEINADYPYMLNVQEIKLLFQ